MKALLFFAAAIFACSAVSGQNKDHERIGLDTALNLKKIQGASVGSADKKAIIFGYQRRTNNPNSDPFVLKPYHDSLSTKAVEMPNAYQRAADKSVDIPTYSLRPFSKADSKPIAYNLKIVKP